MPERASGAPDRGDAAGVEASRGPKKRKGSKRDREVVEYRAREQRLKRMRTTVGFLGLIPFVGQLACDGGVALFCVPWSWYMAVWAGVFGAFIGLSIRLVRERRRFETQQSRAG